MSAAPRNRELYDAFRDYVSTATTHMRAGLQDPHGLLVELRDPRVWRAELMGVPPISLYVANYCAESTLRR